MSHTKSHTSKLESDKGSTCFESLAEETEGRVTHRGVGRQGGGLRTTAKVMLGSCRKPHMLGVAKPGH